jgi:hypothetical protein
VTRNSTSAQKLACSRGSVQSITTANMFNVIATPRRYLLGTKFAVLSACSLRSVSFLAKVSLVGPPPG